MNTIRHSDDENEDNANQERNGEATRMIRVETVTGDNNKATDNDNSDERKTTGGQAPGVKLPPGFPVDRGWAWAILAGYFIITFQVTGYVMGMSIFLLEFMEMFQVPVSTAATFLGVQAACNGLGNVLVTHFVLPRMGPKTTVLIGACMFSVTSVSLFLAPSIIYVNIAHIFIGASFPFMSLPSTTLLNTYFRSRRAFAMSLGQTSISMASMSVPPLVQYFISSFGPRGALLLAGGLHLHALVAGLLMRPVSYYEVRRKQRSAAVIVKREHSQRKTLTDVIEVCADTVVGPDTEQRAAISAEENSIDTEQENAGTMLLDDCHQPKANPSTSFNISQTQDGGPKTRTSLTGLDLNVLTEETSLSCAGESHTPRMTSLNLQKTESHKKLPAYHEDQHQVDLLLLESVKRSNALPSASKTNEGQSNTTIAMDQTEPPSPMQDSSALTTNNRPKTAGTECCHFISSTSLYRSWLFWLLVVYVPLMLSYTRIGIYLPSLAVSQGVSRTDAALLLTVSGCIGLVSRVTIGYLADLKLMKVTHIVAFCLTVMGVTAQFCRFFTSFWLLVIIAVINGTVGHAGLTLNTVVIIDLLGLQHLPKVLGFVLLVFAGWNALNHPLIGAIVDATGSFAIAYNYIGACVLASAFVLMMEPIARRQEAKRLQKL